MTAGLAEPNYPEDGGPAPEWIDRVTELYVEHDLPDLMIDPQDAVRVSGHWQLHPWRLGLDLTALAAWAVHLDDPAAAGLSVFIGSPYSRTVIVSGRLAGYPTDLVGCTSRAVGTSTPDRPGLAALAAYAHAEIAVAAPAHARLDLAQQLDPLNHLGPVTA